MAGLVDRLPAPFVAARSAVRPGCTGLWQISADADRLIGEAPHYDLHYLAHMSVRLDLWVLWHSVVVMAGGAAVSWSDVARWARPRRRVLDEAMTSVATR